MSHQHRSQRKFWVSRGRDVSSSPPREIIRLRHVEHTSPIRREVDDDEPKMRPQRPSFRTHLMDQNLIEGGRAQFDARLLPLGDPNLQVEWYHNGQSLPASTRYITEFRFGYVALTILNVSQSDAGVYVCRAFNDIGEAITTASLQVRPPSPVYRPYGYDDEFETIRNTEDSSFYSKQRSVDESYSTSCPVFVKPLDIQHNLFENARAHFEAQITPVNDRSMQVEWYRNGEPMNAGKFVPLIVRILNKRYFGRIFAMN